MSNKKQQIPAIRFNGFTDAWEQRKFSDLIQTMRGGASIAPDDYKDNGVATVPKGAINSTGIADLSGSKYVSKEFFEKNKNSSVYSDELVTSLRDLVPSAPNMGRIVKLEGKDKRYLMPQGVYNLILLDEVDENFLISFSNTSKFRRIISQEKNGSTQVHIRNSEYLGISIDAPDAEEQNKIGSFFKKLDVTIALHQRQLDNYKELKKTMLQQIFNKELRFKDENGNDYPDWRKTLLKKVAKIYDGTHQTPNYKNKGIKFVSVENIKNLEGTTKYISEEDYKKDFKEVPEFGDILMTRIGDVGTSTVVRTYEPLAYYVSLALIKCKNINSEYLNHYIEGEQFQNELWKKILHVAFPKKINKGDIGECMIIYPSVEEQQKIADFLSAIDKQLEKVEQKVELLKEQKKGLMQQMFI